MTELLANSSQAQDALSPWSKHIPALQIALDSVSLGAYKTCPRYYFYSIRRGMTTVRKNEHIIFGLLLHSALEYYDRLKAGCSCWDHNRASLAAVRKAIIDSYGWESSEPTKTRQTLIRSVAWYLERFKDDPLDTYILPNGKPAVELSFRYDTGITVALTGETLLYCGHIDRLVTRYGRPAITDRKTTKGGLDEYFFESFTPDNQISGYDAAGQVILPEPIDGEIIIDGIQVGVNYTRFRRGYVSRNDESRQQWMKDLAFWHGQMAVCALTYGDSPWPQNDKACFGCPFRRVCREPNQEIQEFVLTQSGYYVHSEWNPLITREV